MCCGSGIKVSWNGGHKGFRVCSASQSTAAIFHRFISHSGVNVVNSVTKKVTHLIVADEASRHWAKTNAGTKLTRAAELRETAGYPKLTSERLLF